MIGIEQTSTHELLEPLRAEIGMLNERWSGKTLTDVYAEMPVPEHVDIGHGRRVEAATLDAVDGEYDGTDVVLALAYMQGFTPHHHIQARTMQELIFPHSRVIVLPNETDSVSLTEDDRRLMAEGVNPLPKYQMIALEKLGLGTTALTGFSFGGLIALGLAREGSEVLEVTKVNADEIPSEANRDSGKLMKDFQDSSGIPALHGAIKDARIPSLSQAMNPPRMLGDIARFGYRAFISRDGRLMRQTMTGLNNGVIAGATHQLGGQNVKVGYVEGSRMFNVTDMDLSGLPIAPVPAGEGPRIVHYVGKDFRAHAAVDNPILHAGMVNDGLHH